MSKSESIFLANISHEVRTPISGILGMLALLQDTNLNSKQREYVSMINECSYTLMNIINNILDYSKLEVGKIKLDEKPMKINECIESTNDIINSKLCEKRIEYSYKIDINNCILGDSQRLKQILLNLLSNSIKFTNNNGIIFLNVYKISQEDFISLKNKNNENDIYTDTDTDTNTNKDNIFIRFDISDTGCGIDNSDINKLFKSFSQIDSRITSKIYQGSGLGLVICKQLVELMNGCIWLEKSECNRGSTFSFILSTKIYNDKNELILQDSNEYNNTVLKNKNVLIIDDNFYNRISLTGVISKWGMHPHAFGDAEEAIHFTKIIKFDIGLIDLCMPKMDGITFAKKLGEHNINIPLIALSSLCDNDSELDIYFQSSIIKPYKELYLKNICINLLNNKSNTVINKVQTTIEYLETIDTFNLKDSIRILLADDIQINQKIIVYFLNKLNFNNIQVVNNGKECLNLMENNYFDLILLDIRMPILNGEETLKQIKILNKYNPYIIAVTAYCLLEDKQKYLDMGFNDYLPKPIDINKLKKCMNKFIETILTQ